MNRAVSLIFIIIHLIQSVSSISQGSYKVKQRQNLDKYQTQYQLIYAEPDNDYYIRASSPVIQDLKFMVTQQDKNIIDLKILDSEEKRYQFPQNQIFSEIYNETVSEIEIPANSDVEDTYYNNPYDFKIQVDEKQFFSFCVKRKETQEKLFDMTHLTFSDLYIQIEGKIPSQDLFGLGQSNSMSFRRKNGIYTLYARDQPKIIDDGTGFKGVYSSHPVYLMRQLSGNYHILLFQSSVGMDIEIEQQKLAFNLIGGIIHMKIFLGDQNPETVIKMYHRYIGGHLLPPFWAFGYHQSRWGYKDSAKLMDVVTQYRQNNLPIDTIWSDLDYMFDKQIFTVDRSKFPQSDIESLLKDYEVKYVPLVDAAVGTQYPEDAALQLGKDMNIFCRSPTTGMIFKGKVWPGPSYFPDFFHHESEKFWVEMIEIFQSQIKFSGIWLDMNQPANFCNGQCDWRDSEKSIDSYKINPKIDFPYHLAHQDISTNTLPPNLLHYGQLLHKDVHNIYGFLQIYYTYKALKENLKKPMPFILSRNSFPGTGRFAFHWTGDNESSFEFLRLSIPSIMLFNMYGIPFTGSDICGFMENTTPELCIRWIQLGSIYPFARNHNHDQAIDQQFYSMGDLVIDVARKNLNLRYSILQHYYTLFVRSKGLGTIFRPLFFEFYDCDECLEKEVLNSQFLIGSELMITPTLKEKAIMIKPFFPKGGWNDLITGYVKQKEDESPDFRPVYNPLNDTVPIFIRAGHLIFYQPIPQIKNTQSLKNVFDVIAGLREIEGKLYAEGVFLNIEQFEDEELISQECEGSDQCLGQFEIWVNKVDFSMEIVIRSLNDLNQDLYIQNIHLYNLSHDLIRNSANSLFKLESGQYDYTWIFKLRQPLNIGKISYLKYNLV